MAAYAFRTLPALAVAAACATEPEGPSEDDGVPVVVLEGGVRACARAGERAAVGPFERRQTALPRPSDPWIWHGGMVADDFDGDGLLDLVVALEQGVGLYRGLPGGQLEPHGAAPFGEVDLTYASGGSAADYDGDGLLDLYVTRVSGAPAPEGWGFGENRLLKNLGAGQFRDVTAEAGVGGCGVDFRDGQTRCFRSMASAWGDYDRDGDLDLYVGNYGFVDETDGVQQVDMAPAERDFLFRNEGDGTFADVSDLIPLEFHQGYTYAGGFFDLDDDGLLDLYTVNDFGRVARNRVLWNDGAGGFRFDPDEPSGLALEMTGMGLGIGDLNGDGLPDVAIAEWKNNWLLESNAEGGFWSDAANLRRFDVDLRRGQEVGWGTLMGDVDNDGDLDILNHYGHVVNQNSVWANAWRQADGLYLNDGRGDGYAFVDAGVEWGVADPGMTRGGVLADLNDDGWLDIAKRILDADDPAYLSRCGDAGWARITLQQPGTANTRAVGAKIDVVVTGRVQTRTITAGGVGYASSPPLEAHFGFGGADHVDLIRIRWPDGAHSVVRGPIATRQKLEIVRSSSP